MENGTISKCIGQIKLNENEVKLLILSNLKENKHSTSCMIFYRSYEQYKTLHESSAYMYT